MAEALQGLGQATVMEVEAKAKATAMAEEAKARVEDAEEDLVKEDKDGRSHHGMK